MKFVKTQDEKGMYTRMNRWVEMLKIEVVKAQNEGKSMVMTPLWDRFIIALRLPGIADHPLLEITGPASEQIEEAACQRALGVSGEELRGRMRVWWRPPAQAGAPQGAAR